MIPTALCLEMLDKLLSGHQGVVRELDNPSGGQDSPNSWKS